MNITICVTTFNKSKEDIISLFNELHINSDALFCNQTDNNDSYKLDINKYKAVVKNFNDKGVSKNRNHILDNAYGSICVNIDDDCPLADNYQLIVDSFFNEHPDADVVLFNGIVCKENNRLVHNKKTKRVRKFNDVSYAGGPGLVYRPDKLRSLNVRYNENVGYPNEIYLGEDSLFMYSLIKSKCNFYRSSEVLFRIEEDIDNSSYFNGVTEQYCISKGAITKVVHPYLYWLYVFYYTYKVKHWRECKLSYKEIYKLIKLGLKKSKEIV